MLPIEPEDFKDEGPDLQPDVIDRVIEMAWEDRTPFEAIQAQFALSESNVILLMRKNLNRPAFNRWRKRVHGRKTKHAKLRGSSVNRHQSSEHRKLHRR
jgi:uncharacterized protein (TIGR03643 family)